MAEDETHYTKYEKARMLGSRALQLAMGAPFLIKLSDDDLKRINYNPVEIAKMEYAEGILPITVRRPMPGHDEPAKEEAKEEKAAEDNEAA